MLGVYNYTVILTYFGMLISFTGIFFTTHGDLRNAMLCLMVSGVCDMFDGKSPPLWYALTVRSVLASRSTHSAI